VNGELDEFADNVLEGHVHPDYNAPPVNGDSVSEAGCRADDDGGARKSAGVDEFGMNYRLWR
jgi:hypothetical protein